MKHPKLFYFLHTSIAAAGAFVSQNAIVTALWLALAVFNGSALSLLILTDVLSFRWQRKVRATVIADCEAEFGRPLKPSELELIDARIAQKWSTP